MPTLTLAALALAVVAVAMLMAGVVPWCLFVAALGALLAYIDNRRVRRLRGR